MESATPRPSETSDFGRTVRVGIDVGGTNTDAVLMEASRVLAEVKTSTTADVTSGVLTALRRLLESGAAAPEQVQAVMIGTTHFTNAVVEARRLVPVAAVRLGLPATRSLPPMVDWPERLKQVVGGAVYLCRGGHEFDGRLISAFDRDEFMRAIEDAHSRGISSFAVSSVFSPVTAEHETEAAALIEEQLPDAWVSLSHEIGRIGLLERENATIMNACLRDLATKIVDGFRSALGDSGIDAPMYISQNDGTLMSAEYTERYPVATFASGPTNSMRGAALLSGLDECAVIDIGGTTSDLGVLEKGFPREAALEVEIGGVRTNFRMPDVLSIGIGGGSIVDVEPELAVGPLSVGYQLTERSLVFGGDTLTATDVAVAGGLAEIGDPSLVADLPDSTHTGALAQIRERIAESLDRMKTSRDPIPVVLVGGGSILLEDDLPGAANVVRPDHFAVANAVGAAIAQVGGEVDRVFSLASGSRAEAIEEATAEATRRAVEAGAEAGTVRIVDVEEVGLGYLPGNALRLKVKAVGDLVLSR
ncbi:MAG TPA: hydantoinase/oxoprolinase family protein [Gaiellaceae bacterium]|nr:hydantoinase/oxoprolinase family protein [Gaiellaceae bacterium]